MKLKFLAAFLLVVILGPLAGRAATLYSVAIDTTAWSGQSGVLAFDLLGGDATIANNTATIGSFAGNATLGSTSPFTLTDAAFFNETLRDITFGTSLSFTLQLTENRTAPGFDQFSFFLLDASTLLPKGSTTDPTGADALIAIDIDGQSGGNVSIFGSLTPGISWRVTAPGTNDVRETGSTLAMLAIALAALASFVPFSRSARNGARIAVVAR